MQKRKKRLFTFTVLIAVAAVVIHIVNRIITASACVKRMLDAGVKYRYHWRFGNVYYTKKGNGSPVLLIHDMLPGGSGYEWLKIEDELAKYHTVFNLDLLGCGRSDKPGMIYTNFVYVQLICDFIRNVIGTKTDVIVNGYSNSFVIMANRYNHSLFDRVIMVNPASINGLKRMPSTRDKCLKCILEIPVFGTLIYHMIVSREAIENFFIENMFFDPFHPDETLLDAYYEASHRGGCFAKNAYVNKVSKYMNIDISAGLKDAECQILIIEGEAENNGKSISDNYRRINPDINLATIEMTKHFPHVENPDLFMKEVNKFFV